MALLQNSNVVFGEEGGGVSCTLIINLVQIKATLKFLCDVCYNVIIIIPHYFMLRYRLIHINALKTCS